MPQKNVLITGPPGIGKTTIIQKIAGQLGERAGGFYTTEMRSGGQRTGFGIVTLDGKTAPLALAGEGGGPRVGRYSVNVVGVDQVAVPSILYAMSESKIVVIDEIGKMELHSVAFRNAVHRALSAPMPLVATVMERPNEFCDEIKRRPDVMLLSVSIQNRDEMPGEVVDLLRTYL
jgi:nucleoside-triphosphatase